MDEKLLKMKCMGIVNQLFDLAEVPVKKRHEINDIADEYLVTQVLEILKLGNVI